MNKKPVRDAELAWSGEFNGGIHIVDDEDENVIRAACGDVLNPVRRERFNECYTSVTHICRDCNTATGVYE